MPIDQSISCITSSKTVKQGRWIANVSPHAPLDRIPDTRLRSHIRDTGARMGRRERIARYRTSGAAAGLVRVEVLIPPEDREALLAFAAQLRAAHRDSKALSPEMSALFDEAVTRHGASCLWNIRPQRTAEGMLVIAGKLRQHGGMDAWRLATRIGEELSHAP
jgi:hypothetical protein